MTLLLFEKVIRIGTDEFIFKSMLWCCCELLLLLNNRGNRFFFPDASNQKQCEVKKNVVYTGSRVFSRQILSELVWKSYLITIHITEEHTGVKGELKKTHAFLLHWGAAKNKRGGAGMGLQQRCETCFQIAAINGERRRRKNFFFARVRVERKKFEKKNTHLCRR